MAGEKPDRERGDFYLEYTPRTLVEKEYTLWKEEKFNLEFM